MSFLRLEQSDSVLRVEKTLGEGVFRASVRERASLTPPVSSK